MANEPAEPVPTAADIIVTAMRKAGIIGYDEVPEQPQLYDAMHDANDLLAQWQRNRYLIYHLVNYIFTSTGAQTYSVGLGQTVNINPRPDRLESAYLRIVNQAPNNTPFALPPDIQLDILPSMEDYNRIVIKTLGTLPYAIFYDPAWPVGTLYPWPIPQQSIYEINVTFKETLARFPSLQTPVNLPPEYQPALKWCLAEVLRTSYQLPADPQIAKFSRRALNSVRLANVAVPLLAMPRAVSGQQRAYDYHGSTDVD